MKKLLFVLVAFFMFGQEYAQGQFFSIGPKAGISSSSVQINDNFDGVSYTGGDAKLGFHVGLYTRLKIPLFGLYVQPEALYVSSGGKVNVDDGVSVDVSDVHFSKFDVPVMLGIRIAKVLRLFVGPDFSFLLNSDSKPEIDANFKSSTVGYQAGIGLDVGRLGVDLKYEGNLSAFGEEIKVGGSSFSTDMRNNQLIFSLGWRL